MLDTGLNSLHVAVVSLGVLVLSAMLFRRRRRLPYPPGPKGFPLIGNILEMPSSHEWIKFADWGEQYGDVVYLNLLGQPLVILNAAKHAIALLEKRSEIYSDRPILTVSCELVGWKYSLALSPYGERFREYRRFIARWIGGHVQIEKHHDLVQYETNRFLMRLLDDPDNFAGHIRKLVGAIVLKIAYGYEVREEQDPIVDAVDRATDQFALITSPGAFLADVFPALQYLPSWMPGARFKKLLPNLRKTINEMADLPFDYVKQQMDGHINSPSLASYLLQTETLSDDKEFNIKWSATSLYGGGADTTVSAIHSFFLAMALYPQVQKRAQVELDAIVGAERLPLLSDRGSLPYIEALVKEVLRWNPVAPLGLPHRTTQDDIYERYYIPRGTLVIANIWKFLHDPSMYPDPLEFDPSRHLPGDEQLPAPDPKQFCFGFGRRICPGMYLADASLFIACARTLATFNITKAIENGEVVEPKPEYTSGTISHPKPFKCRLEPRSEKAEALILSEEE